MSKELKAYLDLPLEYSVLLSVVVGYPAVVYHRLAEGKVPFCIDVCPARARFFGDKNNPGNTVSLLLKARPHFQYLQGKGTEPSVFFLE